MPIAVYVLGLAIFAQGTSELMLAGLLPEIARDLEVSIPDTGLLISAFAIGMLVGAPLLAALTMRWSRRTALLSFLAVFVATHVIGALTTSYPVLFATRVIGAFVYAGFWAVAAATAIALVPVSARARAMGILAGGLTVATVLGLPAGTVLGQRLGWQAAFWAVAAICTLAAIGVAAVIPRGTPARTSAGGPGDAEDAEGAADAATPSFAVQVRAVVRPHLWLAYGTTALAIAALMVVFGYLAPLLTETAGLPADWVPVVLALYGLGTVAGITIGARRADSRPFGVLAVGLLGLISASVTLALTAQWLPAAVALSVALGMMGFGINPVLNARVFALAGEAPTLAAGVNVSSFNLGITVGPWLGGVALGAGAGYATLGWIGAGLGALALLLGWLGFRTRVGTVHRTDGEADRPAPPRPSSMAGRADG